LSPNLRATVLYSSTSDTQIVRQDVQLDTSEGVSHQVNGDPPQIAELFSAEIVCVGYDDTWVERQEAESRAIQWELEALAG